MPQMVLVLVLLAMTVLQALLVMLEQLVVPPPLLRETIKLLGVLGGVGGCIGFRDNTTRSVEGRQVYSRK